MSYRERGNYDENASDSAPRRRPERSGSEAQAAPGSMERVMIESGTLVVIDQFMLGNSQFFSQFSDSGSNGSGPGPELEALTPAVKRYGGAVIQIPSGNWSVYRNPKSALLVLFQGENQGENRNPADSLEDRFNFQRLFDAVASERPIGRVFVDTRCVVFIDANRFSDAGLMKQYAKLRNSGDDKPARDLLRENGAAVRYGFQKYGDELGVFDVKSEGCIALWPEIVD